MISFFHRKYVRPDPIDPYIHCHVPLPRVFWTSRTCLMFTDPCDVGHVDRDPSDARMHSELALCFGSFPEEYLGLNECFLFSPPPCTDGLTRTLYFGVVTTGDRFPLSDWS